MPTPTYTLIDSVTLGSSAASVTFSSIDQTYGDLVLVVDALAFTTNAYGTLRFNGDSGSNYPAVRMIGDGSSASSGNPSSTFIDLLVNSTTTNKSLATASIMDYSATNKHKSVLIRSNVSTFVAAIAGRYAVTSAITSLTVDAVGSNTYAASSTFFLYGIAKAL